MVPRLNRIWRVRWWFCFFLLFLQSISVWENCFEKSKLFIEAETWNQDLFGYVELDGNFRFFVCFCFWLDIHFMGITHNLMVQKSKIDTLNWNLVLRLIWICRIQWWCSIFALVNWQCHFLRQIWNSILMFILLFSNGNVLFRQI